MQDPFTAKRWRYQMPGGGRGFTRVPSLVSVWSTAPFLLNNRLGPFSERSVGRRADESVRRLDRTIAVAGKARPRGPGFDGYIVRTTRAKLMSTFRSGAFRSSSKSLVDWLPAEPFRKCSTRTATFKLGPIPKGFPINLAANYQPLARSRDPRRSDLQHDKATCATPGASCSTGQASILRRTTPRCSPGRANLARAVVEI